MLLRRWIYIYNVDIWLSGDFTYTFRWASPVPFPSSLLQSMAGTWSSFVLCCIICIVCRFLTAFLQCTAHCTDASTFNSFTSNLVFVPGLAFPLFPGDLLQGLTGVWFSACQTSHHIFSCCSCGTLARHYFPWTNVSSGRFVPWDSSDLNAESVSLRAMLLANHCLGCNTCLSLLDLLLFTGVIFVSIVSLKQESSIRLCPQKPGQHVFLFNHNAVCSSMISTLRVKINQSNQCVS